jgi:proteic killer suppression protein
MIRSFRHKGLRALFLYGRGEGVRPDLVSRCLRCLDALEDAESFVELTVRSYRLHALHGSPKRYSIHVNGPWCITFEWNNGSAYRVDLEQYH